MSTLMNAIREADSAPKYRQVLDLLRGEILSGRYRPGEKLPSEAALVKRFGASRITIGRAVRELQDQDLIERRAGSGTYVRPANGAGPTFGLIIPNLGETEIFEPICRGMADASEGRGHALIWGNSSPGGDKGEKALQLCRQYVERQVSGVFFAPLEFTERDETINRRIAADLDRARIPLVLLDRCFLPYPQRSRYDLVGIDNRRAGYLASAHLLGMGSRRVAFLSYAHSASTVGARLAGYREALLFHGCPVDPALVPDLPAGDAPALEVFLDAVRPDALVCSNDRLAAELMPAILASGRKIPDDLRMVGIDDAGYAAFLPVPLTTIRQPAREIGTAAMDAMLGRLARPSMPTRDILLATRLIVRQSCGAPKIPFVDPRNGNPNTGPGKSGVN